MMTELSYHLSEKAVEHIAEAAISDVPGSVALDAKLAGLAGRSLPRATAYMDKRAGTVAIDADIAAIYPSPVAAVTDAVRETVTRHIHTLTGLEVTRVNIKVVNTKAAAPGSAVSAEQVAWYDSNITPIAPQVTSSTHVRTVSAPTTHTVRSTGFRPGEKALTPVDVPDQPELARVGFTPVAVTSPRVPAPQPLRQIYIEPVVIPRA